MNSPRRLSGGAPGQLDPAGLHLSRTEQVLFFLAHPGWIKYYRRWQETLRARQCAPEVTALDYKLPWFTYAAIEWTQGYLRPDMRVFEFGSGGSTVFFAERVASVVSVEHNLAWHEMVSRKLQALGRNNVDLLLVEPGQSDSPRQYGSHSFTSITFPEYAQEDFTDYVKTLDRYPDAHFDLIVIDGRARASCIPHALQKVRAGGCIVLDNSERPYYAEAMDLLAGHRRWDFVGFGPLLATFWRTTVWKVLPTRGSRP